MALILNIDTALEFAGISIARDGQILSSRTNDSPMDHSSWLHQAIAEALLEANLPVAELDAVAVAAGPGSYTGLRVGMASAKGISYARNLPLISISNLYLLAAGAQNSLSTQTLICPMIDARRMEVFTVLFDEELSVIEPESALILNEHSFQQLLSAQKILFCGNGSLKFRSLCDHPNAAFSADSYTLAHLALASFRLFDHQTFSDLAYLEPSYVKNFYTGTKDA